MSENQTPFLSFYIFYLDSFAFTSTKKRIEQQYALNPEHVKRNRHQRDIIISFSFFKNQSEPKVRDVFVFKSTIMISLRSTFLTISCLLLSVAVQTEAIAGAYHFTPDCWRAKKRSACVGNSYLRKGCIWCDGLCKHHGACHLHKRCSLLKAGTPLQREICIAHGCKVQDRKCVKASEARPDPDAGICPPDFPDLKVVWQGTAPFCKKTQCDSRWRELGTDKTGDGAKCLTGTKVKCGQCCRKRVIHEETYWWGKGPACRLRSCPPGWQIIDSGRSAIGPGEDHRYTCRTGFKRKCERKEPVTVEECMIMDPDWGKPDWGNDYGRVIPKTNI